MSDHGSGWWRRGSRDALGEPFGSRKAPNVGPGFEGVEYLDAFPPDRLGIGTHEEDSDAVWIVMDMLNDAGESERR